ncbi:MAG TPA: hypothetical protein DCK98_11295 [Chloroflexi bacterium]|nr:hypothetical protein [Chloroflexota bacterium]HAL28939.1 hypothetical protein [Chloroflexota bacterium]
MSTTSNLWLGHAVRPEQDPQFIRDTIADVDALAATDAERRIYEGTPAGSFASPLRFIDNRVERQGGQLAVRRVVRVVAEQGLRARAARPARRRTHEAQGWRQRL